ncbi:cysteine synthase [Salpingoeca rosetta]|uniref:Cysteine synthase 1 n=1 Tax=Salpingoeca rosetta (strain ATCC 50818 / BSB-021) TaxID=946362 RepID=F2UC64_SALR5|nr:cysteine synthase [Salpingoeca rosetta]EGD74171.1 cysteine synthase [Salpingoeca rosetta]|eukprot:XP_004993071.1 cysteine synthase [Salpingoeca rosetta]
MAAMMRQAVRHAQTATAGAQAWKDYVRAGFVGAVGKTPLIKLKGPSEATGCNILVKNEAMNPGGSVKDRAALFLIQDAEERGLIKPGGTVVEGTAGNTGIGLAHICNAKGYKCVIYMPDTQSKEKIDTLRTLGADVRPVPAKPFDDPMNYNHQARRFSEELDNAVWTNQFDNTANRDAHYHTTGPEIWHQTEGRVDAFTCATGTGGTLAGTGMFLKEMNPNVQIVLADPPGSVLYNFFQRGVLEREGTGSITEGIGQGRVTANMEGAPVDYAIHMPDEKSVEVAMRLLYEEGFCVGASSGLNVAAAIEVAQQMGPGHTVVSLLCDNGLRYATRLFNRSWLETKGLLASVPTEFHDKLIS